MKKFIAIILALCLFSGCAYLSEKQEDILKDYNEMSSIDIDEVREKDAEVFSAEHKRAFMNGEGYWHDDGSGIKFLWRDKNDN